jgi:hypothetical protein
MPYGIAPEQGGDSKENDAFMEKCVAGVMKSGKDKSSAIAICKSTLKKKKNSKSELDFILDEEIIKRVEDYKEQYIRKTMSGLNVDFKTANNMFDIHLSRNNYNLP